MPQQVAVIAVLRHWWDPSWHVPRDYELALGDSQYILYHAVGAALSLVVGSAERANLVLLTLVGIAFPYALRSLLRALQRDERLAIFGAFLFWSAPLMMGFVPYVASVPVVVWGLALVVRQAGTPSRARSYGLTLLALALFYLHVSGYLLFVLTAPALTITVLAGDRPTRQAWCRAARQTTRRMLWIVPSGLMAVVWGMQGSLARSTASHAAPGIRYIPASAVIQQLPVWAHDLWGSHVDEMCAVAYWGAYLAIAVTGIRAPDRSALGRASWLPPACAALTYAALPYNVGLGTMLNTRVALFVVLFMPLLLRPSGHRVTRFALGVVAATTVAGAVNSVYEIARINREELGDVDRLIDRIPAGARVLTLSFRLASPRTHWPPWTFLGSYHVAREGGVAGLSFAELRHWPLHHPASAAPPQKSDPFWTLRPCSFRNSIDGAYFDYVLERGMDDPFAGAPGPSWRKIDEERDWILFEKVPGAVVTTEGPDRGPCWRGPDVDRASPVTTAGRTR
jgi:hypothetical protein